MDPSPNESPCFLRHNIIASKHGNMPIQVKATKVPGYKLPLTLIHPSIAPKKSARGELRAHSPFHFLSARGGGERARRGSQRGPYLLHPAGGASEFLLTCPGIVKRSRAVPFSAAHRWCPSLCSARPPWFLGCWSLGRLTRCQSIDT